MNKLTPVPHSPGPRELAVPGADFAEFYEEKPPAFDIKQILAMIRRHLWLAIGCIAVALAAGIIITMLTTPKYRATASIQIDQESDRVLKNEDVQPSAGYQDADRFLQTQISLLSSRALAQRVAQSLNIVGNPDFFDGMQAKMPAGSRNSMRVRDATYDLLQKHLSVYLPRQSRLANLTFESPDPALAARVVNAYANGFVEYNLERKYDSSAYARSFLSKQLATTKARLEESERQLNAYARQAGLIKTTESGTATTPGQSQSVTTASLVQLNAAANEAKAARIAAEQKWRSASVVPVMSIPEVLTNQAVQSLVSQRAEKASELQNEQALHQAAYPTVQNLRAQVAELDRQIATVAAGVKSSLRDAYRIALDQENQLDAQVASLKGATLAEQDRGVRYNILAREADTNRTLYDGLLQRFKEVSAQAGISTNNISVIDLAEPPAAPSSPRLSVNMGIALLIGLLLAGGAIFIREQMDDVVRGPQDVEQKLGHKLLGVVPQIGKEEDILSLLESPRTAISEAYHALRTSLLYSSTEGLPRTMLVTSTQSGEGKSTTSYAIAADLARLGLRVALVDTDMRRPSLHNLLGTPNTVGLSTVLTRQCDLSAAIINVPVGGGMSFVPAGPIPPSPTELLGSSRLIEFLVHLSGTHDAIILDSPPVLGLADAPILTSQADATIFVVEANRGHRGATKAALRRLHSARSNVLGIVLTKFDAKKAGLSEYYGYNYYYYGNYDTVPPPRRVNAG